MKRKLIRVCVIAFLVVMFSMITVSATQETTTFMLYRGDPSSYSTLCTKYVNPGFLYVYLHPENIYQSAPDWIQGEEAVNLRARTSSRNEAGYMYSYYYQGEYHLTYYSNSGYIGNSYYLYANYGSDQPYSWVKVVCDWTP